MIAVKKAEKTDVVIGFKFSENPEMAEMERGLLAEYSAAVNEASASGFVTKRMLDAYVGVMGSPMPGIGEGYPYSHLLGTALDPNLVFRG